MDEHERLRGWLAEEGLEEVREVDLCGRPYALKATGMGLIVHAGPPPTLVDAQLHGRIRLDKVALSLFSAFKNSPNT